MGAREQPWLHSQKQPSVTLRCVAIETKLDDCGQAASSRSKEFEWCGLLSEDAG